jgi:hypothetical protein
VISKVLIFLIGVSGSFTLRPIDKKAKKSEKRHWRDLMGNVGEAEVSLPVLYELGEEKMAMEASQFSIDKLVSLKVTEVGRVDPIGDFRKIMDTHGLTDADMKKGMLEDFFHLLIFYSI